MEPRTPRPGRERYGFRPVASLLSTHKFLPFPGRTRRPPLHNRARMHSASLLKLHFTFFDRLTSANPLRYAVAMRAKKFGVLTLAVVFSISLFLSAQQSATVPVVIVVTDPSGAGAARAQIRVIPAPNPAPKMETDDKGRLALELKPGGYALFALLGGFKELVTHF